MTPDPVALAKVTGLVPSQQFPTASDAFAAVLPDATSVSAAVAFVTNSGVDILAGLLEANGSPGFEIVARGAPVTEQTALVRLRDQLGAEVAVVMGPRAPGFHPKLWLVRRPRELVVISGSGNLTKGGLVANVEQFEVLRLDDQSGAAEEQEARFDELIAEAQPLDEVEGSPTWRLWAANAAERERLDRQLRRLDAKLELVVPRTREDDKARLCADLLELYAQTVAAKLPRADGQPYIPHRFKQAIDRARAGGDPVLVVTRMCRRQTEGFDVILEANRPDLTVESLVVDDEKAYHDLFVTETVRLSRERLEKFDPDPNQRV